jgi:hypothetical protein
VALIEHQLGDEKLKKSIKKKN